MDPPTNGLIKNINVSWGRVVWSAGLLVLSSLSTCFLHFYLGFAKVHIRRTLKVISASFTNLLSLVVIVKNRHEVISLHQGLRCAEYQLASDGVAWRWDGSFLILYRSHFIYLLALLINMAARARTHSFVNNLFHLISYLGTLPILLAIIGQFVALQDLLRSLFNSLLNVEGAKEIVIAVDALHSVAESAQRIYGLQILLYITCLFSFVVCNTYYQIVEDYGFTTSFIHISWLVIFMISVFEVVSVCNSTMTKARKVNEVLYQRIMDDNTDKLVNDDLLEFHMFCSSELEFTAYGFFTLNNSLIYSMITAATTYLVILLQYTLKPKPTAVCPQ